MAERYCWAIALRRWGRKCSAADARNASSFDGFVQTVLMASARARTSPLGNVTPHEPTASIRPPPSEATIARPHAIPSSATMPKASFHKEGTKTIFGQNRALQQKQEKEKKIEHPERESVLLSFG